MKDAKFEIMDGTEKIKLLKENIREEIDKEMRSLVNKFKEYVTTEHPDNPKHVMIEGVWYRNNYGVVDSKPFWPPEIPLDRGERKNYYCYLSDHVYFIHLYRIWRSNVIFYNDEIGGWYVYDSDNKQYIEFDGLDTDTQIKMLEMLKKCIEIPSPEAFLEELEQRNGKI